MTAVKHIEEPLLKNLRTFVAFTRKRIGDSHLAEDVVQESLLKALRSDRKPTPDEDVVAWFYRILRRSIIDLYRRRDVREHALDRLQTELPEQPTAATERVLCQCVKRLLPDCRNTIVTCSSKLTSMAQHRRRRQPRWG